ncbi:MAG: FKBP-type peptidyl-prolyl cis-trans isomerase [Planctomycetia bacterium]|nr:FKBP-type peptidyl-prolyl cis-trans isomerase [Planctomycetia bacterium]
MKSFIVAVVGLAVAVVSGVAAGQDAAKESATKGSAELKDLKSKASYSIGLSIGRNLKGAAVDVDSDLIARGLKDGVSGAKALLTDEELQKVMQDFQAAIVAKKMEESKGAGDKNKKEGDAFLAANKAKPDVKVLPSGLQYKVIKEGTGATPKPTDTVTTNYRGTLIDGTEFDSSYKRNEPASFPVNGVIRGWTEALQRMKVGSKWQLYIPSELAYGPNGSPPVIGPNSVLVFDIELLGVGPAPAPAGR